VINAYIVWDSLNSSEGSARRIVAYSARDAAIAYARKDSDGLTDGLYTNYTGDTISFLASEGHPISVRDDRGQIYQFRVGIVEFEPVFDAEEIEEEGKP